MRGGGSARSVADALSRFTIKVAGGSPFPERESRGRLRTRVKVYCVWMDVIMIALCQVFRPPSHSAFEGPLPDGGLRRLPRLGIIELALDRLLRSIGEGWRGAAHCLVPAQPSRRRFVKLLSFVSVLRFPQDAPLFTHPSSERPEIAPNELVIRPKNSAYSRGSVRTLSVAYGKTTRSVPWGPRSVPLGVVLFPNSAKGPPPLRRSTQ